VELVLHVLYGDLLDICPLDYASAS
jgi:hypothetical protein